MNKKFLATVIVVIGIVLIMWAVRAARTHAPVAVPAQAVTSVTILAPQDLAAYDKAMNSYVFDGGQNPAPTWPMVKKTVTVATTTEVLKASAQAAAGVIQTQGGTIASEIKYFRIVDDTAYVLMGMQLNAWAGVSVSIAKIEPIVERTLLQFPEIKTVKFDVAPGDTAPVIQ